MSNSKARARISAPALSFISSETSFLRSLDGWTSLSMSKRSTSFIGTWPKLSTLCERGASRDKDFHDWRLRPRRANSEREKNSVTTSIGAATVATLRGPYAQMDGPSRIVAYNVANITQVTRQDAEVMFFAANLAVPDRVGLVGRIGQVRLDEGRFGDAGPTAVFRRRKSSGDARRAPNGERSPTRCAASCPNSPR